MKLKKRFVKVFDKIFPHAKKDVTGVTCIDENNYFGVISRNLKEYPLNRWRPNGSKGTLDAIRLTYPEGKRVRIKLAYLRKAIKLLSSTGGREQSITLIVSNNFPPVLANNNIGVIIAPIIDKKDEKTTAQEDWEDIAKNLIQLRVVDKL